MATPLRALDALSLLHVFPVMKELRPHLLDAPSFVAQVLRQQAQGYELWTLADGSGQPASAIGFRPVEFLAWGRVLYIDDLITAAQSRRQGLAQCLLEHAFARARDLGCAQVHLDSGHQRHDAHRLYLDSGFRISSHHFSK